MHKLEVCLLRFSTALLYVVALGEKMNLGKVGEEEKVTICRKYFIGGFFFLPALWIVNCIWFSREAVKKSANRDIRKYVAGSLIGAVIWTAMIVIWISLYQTQRVFWGNFGDYISFTVPYGRE